MAWVIGLAVMAAREGADVLTVDSIRIREIRMPLREPFRISSGVVAERRICLIEVRDADGFVGWGEAAADHLPYYSPETVDTVWLAVREWIAPRLLGNAMEGPQEILPRIEAGIQGHRMAKAAIEMACWALMAERRTVPLARLLGGTRQRIETGISIGLQSDVASLVERAIAARQAGYRKIKVKVQPGADLVPLRAVRQAVGMETPLAADANSAYSPGHADHLASLDELELTMLEQPLGQDDLVRHAALQRRLRTPICLDESITGLDRAMDMVALGSGRIVTSSRGAWAGSRRRCGSMTSAPIPASPCGVAECSRRG
jgi:o-succinylbenzoate synthase